MDIKELSEAVSDNLNLLEVFGEFVAGRIQREFREKIKDENSFRFECEFRKQGSAAIEIIYRYVSPGIAPPHLLAKITSTENREIAFLIREQHLADDLYAKFLVVLHGIAEEMKLPLIWKDLLAGS